MKTKKLYMILISILFITSTVLNAQITRRIERVAGKEVKTKVWKGREIQFVEREIAVKITPSATQTEINDLLKAVDGRVINAFDELGWGLIELPTTKDEILAIDDLLKLPFVSVAEPNMVTSITLEPNDPYFKGTTPATYSHLWALKNTGQTPPTGTNDADIDATDAWDISTGNSDVIIAILDSGIPMQNGSLSHPDLDDPNKIILGPDYIFDANGVKDELGHGTHVAGIAAAESNNGIGIAGVAWNNKIMVIQVFDAYGAGTWSAFYKGIIYAVIYQNNNPGKKVVINYSGGGGGSQQALDAVIHANTYGIPIIASAGNANGGAVVSPAAYSSVYQNVIAVSSTDATDIFSPFSSQGRQVCVSAPGGYGGYWDGNVLRYNGPLVLGKNIFSTTPNYPFTIAFDPIYKDDPYSTDVSQNYGYMAGTSMAAPIVTGIAALMLSVKSDLTPSQLRSTIQSTAEDKGTPGFDNYYGHGRVNAHRALLPLIAPANFQNTAVSGFVTLIWSATNNPILQYYEVERKINSGSWTVIATTTDISYLDNEFRVQSSGFTTAQYRVRQKSMNDVYSNYSSIVTVNGIFNPTDKNIAIVKIPSEYRLDQNHPNPFNPTTTIQYQIPEDANVVVKVYNLLGSEVATLVNEFKPTGYYTVKFDASSLPSGLYLYKISAGTFSETRKMLLMK